MTRAERLNAILEKVNPSAMQHMRDTEDPTAERNGGGSWPADGCPYVCDVQGPNRRVRVRSADGDVIAGVGPTMDDALAALEGKLGLSAGE